MPGDDEHPTKDGCEKGAKVSVAKNEALLKTIASHAKRRRDRLESSWQSTRYSHAQANRIIARIDPMLTQVPAVIEQAHERSIGERLVHSSAKIFNVYDSNINVLVRGKAGKVVELGNTLMIAVSTPAVDGVEGIGSAAGPTSVASPDPRVPHAPKEERPPDILFSFGADEFVGFEIAFMSRDLTSNQLRWAQNTS